MSCPVASCRSCLAVSPWRLSEPVISQFWPAAAASAGVVHQHVPPGQLGIQVEVHPGHDDDQQRKQRTDDRHDPPRPEQPAPPPAGSGRPGPGQPRPVAPRRAARRRLGGPRRPRPARPGGPVRARRPGLRVLAGRMLARRVLTAATIGAGRTWASGPCRPRRSRLRRARGARRAALAGAVPEPVLWPIAHAAHPCPGCPHRPHIQNDRAAGRGLTRFLESCHPTRS